MTEHANCLSPQEKRQLARDGFVILRNAVSRKVTERAKAVINTNPTRIVWGDHPAINGLYTDSILVDVVDEAMGRHTRPVNAQVAVTMPRFQDAVVRGTFDPDNLPTPQGHVDGGWAGLCPLKRSEILAAGGDLATWGMTAIRNPWVRREVRRSGRTGSERWPLAAIPHLSASA